MIGIQVLLVGDEDVLKPLTDLTVVHAPETVGMDDNPTARRMRGTSVRKAAELVKSGKADAAVDFGNSGAAFVAAYLVIGHFDRLDRPTIGTRIPRMKPDGTIDYSLLLDAGANIDTEPSMMGEWAVLGSHYASLVMGIEKPRVGLTSNGEEKSKGTPFVLQCHQVLQKLGAAGLINFVGNIQGGEMFEDQADVILSDGFTGNVQLKLAESMGKMIIRRLHSLGLDDEAEKLMEMLDKDNGGASLLLGMNKPYLIGHGSSNRTAVRTGIVHAHEVVRAGTVASLKEKYESLQQTS